VFTPISCDDKNPCTVDTCNERAAAGTDPCVHTIKTCVPSDPNCYDAFCNPVTGNCVEIKKEPLKLTFVCPPDIKVPCGTDITKPENTGGYCRVTGPLVNGQLPVVTITWEDTPIDANCTGQRGVIRIFTATDVCGNKQPCNFGQKIEFMDDTPPTIDCRNRSLITCDTSPVLLCASAQDNCLQPVAITYKRSDGVSITCVSTPSGPRLSSASGFPVGTTTVTATATDTCGNKAECSFTVTVNAIICGFNECCCNLCPGQSRTLTPNYFGGVGPYTFEWTKVELPGIVLQSGSNPSYTVGPATPGGAAGHYKVKITDHMGCTCTTADYQVTVDNLVVQVNAPCTPYTFPTGQDGSANTSGSVEVGVSGGGIPLNDANLAVCDGTTVTLNGSFTGGVAPFRYLWERITPNGPLTYGNSESLVVSEAGIYRLTIIDASCQASLDTIVHGCQQCVTRPVEYWRTHAVFPDSVTVSCAALKSVFNLMPGGQMNLGFITVTLDQALGIFWLPDYQAGQDEGDPVCMARKQLSRELIAAIANVTLLNADSSNCGVIDEATGCFYPIATLIQEAQAATQLDAGLTDCNMQGWWINQMNSLRAWLAQFNNAGASQPLPENLRNCGVGLINAAYVAGHQQDPTTTENCTCNPIVK